MQHISRLRLLKPTSTNTALRYASNVTPGPSGSSSSSNPARPPYLPRPLGVRQAPSKIKLTKQEEKARFLDPERRSEERKAITKELQKSYFQDLSSLSQNGGKLWIAPETVIRAEVRHSSLTTVSTLTTRCNGQSRRLSIFRLLKASHLPTRRVRIRSMF